MKIGKSPEAPVVDEETPLLREKQPEIEDPGYSKKSIELIVCAAVAFPTAALNGLSALVKSPEELMQLHSLSSFNELLQRSSWEKIGVASGSFILSEGVFLYMNSLYFVPSSKAAIDLIRRIGHTGTSIICCSLDNLSPENRAQLSEVGLFCWSLGTSLIFAEMGRQGLSFLGVAGERVGYTTSLLVYFSTRYASTKFFNANERAKKRYLDKLELLTDDAEITPITVKDNKLEDALIRFLAKVDSQWDSLPKSQSRVILLEKTAPVMGYACVLITLIPIMSSFIPFAIKGVERPTRWDIGKSEQYQNASSLTFGAFSTALTLFFYELGIHELPRHCARTTLLIYEKIKRGDKASAAGLLLMTALAFSASYSTGMGFRTMASDAVNQGYLSYLGESLSRLMPDGLFAATAGMLWSHLQNLVNQTFNPQSVVKSNQVRKIDLSNVRSLLKQTPINFSKLLNDHGVFASPPPVITSRTPTPTYHQHQEVPRKSRCVIL